MKTLLLSLMILISFSLSAQCPDLVGKYECGGNMDLIDKMIITQAEVDEISSYKLVMTREYLDSVVLNLIADGEGYLQEDQFWKITQSTTCEDEVMIVKREMLPHNYEGEPVVLRRSYNIDEENNLVVRDLGPAAFTFHCQRI